MLYTKEMEGRVIWEQEEKERLAGKTLLEQAEGVETGFLASDGRKGP